MRRLKKKFNIILRKSPYLKVKNEWLLIPSISFHTGKEEGFFNEDGHQATDYFIVITFAFLQIQYELTLQFLTKWYDPDALPF